MAIGTTNVSLYAYRDQAGILLRVARIDVTGLAAGANTVPHGLTNFFGNAIKPVTVGIEPTSNSTIWETSAADATNIYLSVSGAGTTCSIYVEY